MTASKKPLPCSQGPQSLPTKDFREQLNLQNAVSKLIVSTPRAQNTSSNNIETQDSLMKISETHSAYAQCQGRAGERGNHQVTNFSSASYFCYPALSLSNSNNLLQLTAPWTFDSLQYHATQLTLELLRLAFQSVTLIPVYLTSHPQGF